MSAHIAAIDIGTNSVLMLLSRAAGAGRFVTVSDRAEVTRLGEGLDRSGILSPQAIERTLATLGRFAAEAHGYEAKMVAVGTSALRDASNASELLEPAGRILGVDIQVITGEREAVLAFRGALLGLDLDQAEVTVVDVGGGSVEVTQGTGDRLAKSASIRLGAVRLLERCNPGSPATAEQLAAMQARAAADLDRSRIAIRGQLIAVGGTATTAAAVLEGLGVYDPDRIHGRRTTREELEGLLIRLAGMPLEERNGLKGLQKGREDVIVPGIVILHEVLRIAGSGFLSISTGGIRVALTAEASRGCA